MAHGANWAAVEIGGTKLQVAIAPAGEPGRIIETWRTEVRRQDGAAGILAGIERGFAALAARHRWEGIGVGFGGPVDAGTGRVGLSHQVDGWEGFELAEWFRTRWAVPVAIDNDCNVAALAEAVLGAGRGGRRVLYVTVGTGVGGGFVVDGRIDGAERPAVAELGHLRPGLDATDASSTVESLASGLGIERLVRSCLADGGESPGAADLRGRCGGDPGRLTTRLVAEAAAAGNPLAGDVLGRAARVLGWAVAQATTILAPERVVLGGGVCSAGEAVLAPLRGWWREYVFPPLREACELVPGELGDLVVLHGALLVLAARRERS